MLPTWTFVSGNDVNFCVGLQKYIITIGLYYIALWSGLLSWITPTKPNILQNPFRSTTVMLEQWFEGMLQLLPATLIITHTHTHIYILYIWECVWYKYAKDIWRKCSHSQKQGCQSNRRTHVHINTKWHSSLIILLQKRDIFMSERGYLPWKPWRVRCDFIR